MVFTLKNQNEIFLKYALNEQIFGVGFFDEEEIRDQLIEMLAHKSKTEFVLNVLIYADFSRWPQSTIKDLIEKIAEITNETVVAQNRILLSYNPI